MSATCSPALAELDRLPTPLNDGERAVLEALLRLGDDWEVYVQPRLALIQPDFIVINDHAGVYAVEVKDWNPGAYQRGEKGIEVNDGARWVVLGDEPLKQAERYRKVIFDEFFLLPDSPYEENQAVQSVLAFPQFSTSQTIALLPPRPGLKVIGTESLAAASLPDLRQSLNPGVTPRAESMARLRRYLAEPEFVSDQRRDLQFSKGARNLAINPDGALIRRSRGPAGCGKSLALAARAVRLALEGKQVLVLSYNITLAHYLRDIAKRHARTTGLGPGFRNITFTHFAGFLLVLLEESDRSKGWHDDWIAWAVSAVDDLYSQPGSSTRQYDAVLVDEGQDFNLEWWNLLRHRVLRPSGEMLLVADRTQDIYDRAGWTDEETMSGAGFNGRWAELKGTYRMPPDLVPVVVDFATRYLPADHRDLPTIEADHPLLGQARAETVRRWINQDEANLMQAAADAAVSLLEDNPSLHPDDLIVLAEHTPGLMIMRHLERLGYTTSHTFADEHLARQRRKRRFWGGTPGIKGCTPHSFKGWEARAVVLAISDSEWATRLAYISMTRVKGDPGDKAAFITVVNASPRLDAFAGLFERPIGPDEVPALGGQTTLPL